MREVPERGIALIARWEGFSERAYRCPAGVPTIGYGHVILPGERFPAEGIGEEEARDLLRRDAGAAARAVLRLIRVPLPDGRFSALVSFTFNLGAGALQRSALRRKINREEHDDVPAELMKWVWAGGRRLPGLIRRRRAEAAMYANDTEDEKRS